MCFFVLGHNFHLEACLTKVAAVTGLLSVVQVTRITRGVLCICVRSIELSFWPPSQHLPVHDICQTFRYIPTSLLVSEGNALLFKSWVHHHYKQNWASFHIKDSRFYWKCLSNNYRAPSLSQSLRHTFVGSSLLLVSMPQER